MNRNRNILILVIAILIVIVVDLIMVDNPVFVLVFSISMFIMFNVVDNLLLNRSKNTQIKWLTHKLDDTKDTLKRKDVAEKRMVSEIPLGIIIYYEHYNIKWANGYSKDIFENVLEKRNLEIVNLDIFNHIKSNSQKDSFITKVYTHEYEVSIDLEERLIFLTQVTEREEIKRKYDASIGVIAMLNLDNLDDAVSVLDVSNRSFAQGRYLEALEAWGEEYSFYITPLTNSKLIAVMNKKSLMSLIKNEFN